MPDATHPLDPAPPTNEADKLLAELAAQGSAPVGRYGQELSESAARVYGAVVRQAAGGRSGLKALRYTHEDCIDCILASPGISQNDLAMRYGVTAAWMSIVVNCDAFKVKLAERKAELVDPVLAASLNERFGALAQASVDRLLKRVTDAEAGVPDKVLLEAAALGAKAIGMGEPKSSVVNAQDHLAALAHRLIDLNKPVGQAIDVAAREVE